MITLNMVQNSEKFKDFLDFELYASFTEDSQYVYIVGVSYEEPLEVRIHKVHGTYEYRYRNTVEWKFERTLDKSYF